MSLTLPRPIIYLITGGKTTANTSTKSEEFRSIIRLAEAAVAAQIPLLQIREKLLSARVLYDLVREVVELAEDSSTRILVNDRSDVAAATGASGVHLTSHSLTADIVRRMYGNDFLIGVSTHSLDEALAARQRGADFVVFGPVFRTESKQGFGDPQGVERVARVTAQLTGFPVLAIGGITIINAQSCFSAGAAGVAAIQLLSNPGTLFSITETLRQKFENP